MTDKTKFSKKYWIEDTYLWESGVWDYVAIGRVTDEQQLMRDGDNWSGSRDSYNFNCFETLKEALDFIRVRPSSVLWNESLTKEDTKTIREWVREKEPSWIEHCYMKDVKDIVDVHFDNAEKAECDILLNEAQNKDVKCNKELPLVKVVFDKAQNEMRLHRLSENKIFERIDESEDYFENLIKFACDSMYKYCCLYTEQDMRNFYTNSMKMDCITKTVEDHER